MIENSYGNGSSSLRNHFKEIKEKYGRIKGMGVDRFESIYVALEPSLLQINEITDIFHKSFCK